MMSKKKTLIEWFRTGTEEELARLLTKCFDRSHWGDLWCDGKGPCPKEDLEDRCPFSDECIARCLNERKFSV